MLTNLQAPGENHGWQHRIRLHIQGAFSDSTKSMVLPEASQAIPLHCSDCAWPLSHTTYTHALYDMLLGACLQGCATEEQAVPAAAEQQQAPAAQATAAAAVGESGLPMAAATTATAPVAVGEVAGTGNAADGQGDDSQAEGQPPGPEGGGQGAAEEAGGNLSPQAILQRHGGAALKQVLATQHCRNGRHAVTVSMHAYKHVSK